MKKLLLPALILSTLTLTACGSGMTDQEKRLVLSDNRVAADQWCKANGRAYMNENHPDKDFRLSMYGDSTQSLSCLQGDGTCSGKIKNQKGQIVEEVKCPSDREGGCYSKHDFNQRANLVKQEGRCNSELPTQLQKPIS